MNKMTLREKIRFWFDDLDTPLGKAVDLVVIALILIACGLAVAFTLVEEDSPAYGMLYRFDQVISVLFLIEYLLRLWSARRPLRYAFSLYGVIDVVAILPAFAGPGFHLLRIFRLFRIFRLIRFLESQKFFFGAISEIHLYIIRVFFTLLSILFVSAGLIFYAERGQNPDIPTFFEAFYFSVVALTTVGFGDIIPVTTSGRTVTVLMILAGIIFIPWQIKSLISYMLTRRDKEERACDSCGLRFHDLDARHCKHCGVRLPDVKQPESKLIKDQARE